jgi:DNA-binding NarL/FixJ family response regulator
MNRILLADNHRLLHAGIRAILCQTGDLFLIDGPCDSGDLQQRCRTQRPDVVLLAPCVLKPPCPEVFSFLQSGCSSSKVVAMLDRPDAIHLRRLVALGVSGGVLESEASRKLPEVIRTVAQGGFWFSPTLLPALLPVPDRKQLMSLSKRELAVLRLLMAEKTNRDIARTLGIAERTVRYHLHNIRSKLKAQTRVGVAVKALEHSLV